MSCDHEVVRGNIDEHVAAGEKETSAYFCERIIKQIGVETNTEAAPLVLGGR